MKRIKTANRIKRAVMEMTPEAEQVATVVDGASKLKIRIVDVNALEMSEYQRPTCDRQVEKIALEFDAAKAGLIVVSERDGSLYLVDGAHRVAAMRRNNIPACPAIVLHGLTAEEEADYFRRQGENTRRLSNYDRLKAGLVAQDPTCMAIDMIAKKYNYRLGTGSHSARTISSVQALIDIYKRYGIDTLDNTLMIIHQTWDGTNKSIKREYLFGVAEFIKRFGTIDFVERFGTIDFVERFAEIRFNLINLRYQSLHDHMRNNTRAFCTALVQLYNEGIHNPKKRLVMDYDD
jgi:hypothetical protein